MHTQTRTHKGVIYSSEGTIKYKVTSCFSERFVYTYKQVPINADCPLQCFDQTSPGSG